MSVRPHVLKTEILNVRLTPSTVAMVDALAESNCETRSATLRLVVREGLAALRVNRK